MTNATGSIDSSSTLTPLREIALFPDWRNRNRYTTIDGVTYKVASSRSEREAAFALVHEAYTRVGLMEPNSFGMRVTPFHLLPTSDVFLATIGGEAVCTLSLIGDGELGIPMEAIYADEVNELRNQGVHFAEVSCLADKRSHQIRQLPVLTRLISLMLQYARYNRLDQVLLAVHPSHERYYNRFFGCRRFGELRSYPSVLGNPAVACTHEFARLDEQRYPMYDKVYGFLYSPIQLQRQPMLQAEREHFRAAAELGVGYVPAAAV
jgi:N-acyl amino acid synthase FeeM